MLSNCWFALWVALIALSYSLAGPHIVSHPSPLSTHSQNKRAFCNDRTVDITPECWNELGVTGYLTDWWNKHEAECNSTPYQGQGFAACYQQKHKDLNYACSNITVEQCYHPSFSDNTTIQEYYVLYSIFGIWTWYNSIWQAAEDATLLADLQVGAIVDTINSYLPGDDALPGSTSLSVLLSALSAGLALLAFPAGGEVSRLFSTAVQQAPGLTKALLPAGSLANAIKPLDQIESALGDILDQFQINVANTLASTQNNFTHFLNFAIDGSFVANQPSLSASTGSLSRVFKTFIVSQALQSHNIILTVAENFSIYELSHKTFVQPQNGTMLPQNAWHVNCQDQPTIDKGICDNWWVSNRTNNTYALFKLDKMETNFFALMNEIFDKGWTTGEDLFLEADACKVWQSFAVGFPNLDPYTLKASCFSNLHVCSWNQTNDPRLKDGHEFELGGGCAFAWTNLCVDGKGFAVNSTLNNSIYRSSVSELLDGNATTLSILDSITSNAGSAYIMTELDGLAYGFGRLQSPYPYYSIDLEILSLNRVYDVWNNDLDSLQAQADQANPKQCKEYPTNGKRPGWGGAGYHKVDDNCNMYPASYLGPGLYLDTELCGKLG